MHQFKEGIVIENRNICHRIYVPGFEHFLLLLGYDHRKLCQEN